MIQCCEKDFNSLKEKLELKLLFQCRTESMTRKSTRHVEQQSSLLQHEGDDEQDLPRKRKPSILMRLLTREDSKLLPNVPLARSERPPKKKKVKHKLFQKEEAKKGRVS